MTDQRGVSRLGPEPGQHLPVTGISGRSSFTATARPSTASAARHTSPAPPTAIRSCSRYQRASPPRQRNPRGTGDRLHGELVDAAVRVLAAHGDTERLSIRVVAAEAQVTPSAMYRCFPDRRALVRTAVETCFDRFETELAQAEQGAADPFEALRRRCRAYVAFGTAQPHLYRVMFGTWSAGPKALGTSGRRPHPGAGAFTALIASIQRCLNAGAQTRWPSPFLAFQLWSLLHGMTDLRAGKSEMPWPAPMK